MKPLSAFMFIFSSLMASQSAHALCHVTTRDSGQQIAYMSEKHPKGSTRSYTMKGNHYQPLMSASNFEQTGVASWYGRPFHGRKTANGETYNMFSYTAAHPTLPIPSCVEVTNLENGKRVVVRINDRGPFKSDLGTDTSNRVIDLSLKAAIKLGFREKGLAAVKITALPVEEIH